MSRYLALAAAALPLHVSAQPPSPPPPHVVAPPRHRADPQSLIGVEDYPASAVRNGEQGRVAYTLEVGADGRVSACTVTRSSGSSALDSTTCRLMRWRARFTPAMDNNGQPVPSQVGEAVAWTLSGGRPLPPAVVQWGYGMATNVVAPPAIVSVGPPMVNPPAVAIPQDGPGEADLSVWDGRTGAVTGLGRYESIPACRKVKAQLRLRPDQRAWCTVAPD
jgi:TonB family protein